ncbi:hypothetical protein [Streptomyces sp. NPDC088794]|uniref:hypothetical protein n=1 Tax=Streptomyces sp. NPDC088794 TaxID=3365902 RepID=UPI003817F4E1
MSEFEERRDRLAAGRLDREAARAAALAATESVVGVQRRLDSARRTASPDDRAGLASLEQEQADAVFAAEDAQGRLADALGVEARLAESIARFTDPVTAVERLDDRTPILLLPLRIETRFKQSPAGTPQLWVRAYPDTCLVDTFEDSLTATEVANGSAFWAGIWRAVGDEGRERAAWRELVAACGSGRAGWVVRTLLPKNPGAQPEPADDTLDLIVVATGPQPPAVAAFWAATWSAQGQPTATAQARAGLEVALGTVAAALVVANPPVNLDDPPPTGLTPAGTTVRVSVLQLPDAAELGARTTTWSSAPRVDVLPDRLVLVGYAGAGDPQPSLVELGDPIPGSLQAGPDPNAAPADQLKPVGDDPDHPDTLQVPDALAWMFDFERALAVGLAFRVDLSPAQAADGFGRLVLLGVRLTETPSAGSATLGRLLEHHLHSRAGLELLRQGTPTNDTEQGGAAYSWRDDSDASFSPLFKQEPQYLRVADPQQRLDGQRFTDALGIGDALGTRIPGAGLADRVEAQAMQTALWPATIGYLMDTLLAPVFSDEAVEGTREFFTRQVSGRGPLPALRIGAQPYGIQPCVALSRLAWFGERVPTAQAVPAALVRLVQQVEADWRPLLGRVSRIGGDGPDTHQQLLDVVGLHPTSVEYYPLTSDSLEHKAYEVSFFGTGTGIVERLVAMFPANEPVGLLRRLGYAGEEVPDVLTKIYRARQRALDGPIVDDLPLSETTPLRGYAGGRNYIEWLADAAADSITAVQAEQGFDDGKRPAVLLYLLLRHAIQLSFRQTAIGLLASAGAIEDIAVLRREPAFVHVDAAAEASSESRYAELFAPAPAVTGDATLTVGDYIARNVRAMESSVLPEQLEALDRLAGLPTARLERLLAEHVDTASYRIDAWRTGLLGWALDLLRSRPGRGRPMLAGPSVAVDAAAGAAAGGPGGVYLGAYGWVEDLRPEGKTLAPVTLPPDLAADIDKHATVPLTKDPTSLGLVHAPSINHAATAAVLRNAHVAHEGKMSVNLTSRRVRTALVVLEGMRGGQSLGALLGYQLERYLHDNGPLTVRALVYPLRLEYPLVANQIQSTATIDGAAQESIAAMNVVDGRKLLQHVESSGADAYPFDNPRLPRRPAPEEEAVTAALRHIRDVNDAVADLVLAEGVHQAVLGNYDRSAGTLDAFAKGGYPPETDVVRTPRVGTGLTVRTVLHLSTSGPANPWPGLTMTPLASAEPAVNRWLAARLPAPTSVGVRVLYGDRATGTDRVETITQEELGLHPADLLYRAGAKTDQALTDLDERIVERLHAVRPVRLDRPVVVLHTERISGLVTFFELEGLLRSLRRVVVGARPIRPADVMRQGDARSADQVAVSLPRARLTDAQADLRDTLAPTLTPLRAVLADTTTTVDAVIAAYAGTVSAFAAYRIQESGTGFALEWRSATYATITDLLRARVTAWDERLARYDQLLLDYAGLPGTATDQERLQLLRTAEVLVSSQISSGLTPVEHLAALDPKRGLFQDRRNDLHDVATSPRATLSELLADALALADVSAFDAEPLDLTGPVTEVDRFRAELSTRLAQLAAEVGRRVAAAGAALTAYKGAAAGAQARHVRDGLRALLGADLVVAERISLPTAAATELANALTHSTSGGLTKHLTDAPPAGSGRDFPVDDWLHGVARVRERMHHLENVVLLSAGLPGAAAPELTPLQLPHQAGQPWLALEIPATVELTGERLLYTAVHDGALDPAQPLCGLLVDDWTEVVPARQITTGVAFHHDRPNAEPPQAWLLALPASFDGTWSWEELLGAVTETLDAAKLRALEPTHLDTTPYDALLPATYSAWTSPEISISNNLLRNAGLYARLEDG